MTSASLIEILCLIVLLVSASQTEAKCSETVDVAIVGGGPSGAYAAYQLRNSGKKIGLFEYSSRIGGRVYTWSPANGPDLNYELGGMRYLDQIHLRVQRVIDELGLATSVFTEGFGRSGRTRYYWRGESLQSTEGDIPYNLTAEEKANQNDIFRYYVGKLMGKPLKKDYLMTREDEMSMRTKDGRLIYSLTTGEFLDLVASEEGKQYYKDLIKFNSVANDNNSAMAVFDGAFGPDEHFSEIMTVNDGFSAIPMEMIKVFQDASTDHFVKLNMRLEKISRSKEDGTYDLTFMETLTTDDITEDQNITSGVCARQVILAIPSYALGFVDWNRLNQIRKAPSPLNPYDAYTCFPASKIFMTFDKPWWLNAPNAAYVTFTDMHFNHFYDWKKSETGVYGALVSYADGDKVQYLEELNAMGRPVPGSAPGAGRVSRRVKVKLLNELAEAYGVPRESIPEPLSARSIFWSQYPFGCGWWLPKAGYHWADAMAAMRRPSLVDEVYVVGVDYAWGQLTGWMEGGFETVDTVLENYFGL